MSFITKPKILHPQLPRNELQLTVRDYEGAMSTLCAGCGHDSITGAIMQAAFEMAIPPTGWPSCLALGVRPRPRLLCQCVPRLQYRPRSDALGGHRR